MRILAQLFQMKAVPRTPSVQHMANAWEDTTYILRWQNDIILKLLPIMLALCLLCSISKGFPIMLKEMPA